MTPDKWIEWVGVETSNQLQLRALYAFGDITPL